MPAIEPFLHFTDPLEAANIRYMIGGSIAAIYYGEPRLTNDVDIILWLTPDKIDFIIQSFPIEKFYCPPAEVLREEIGRSERGHANLIHHDTGFKADLYFVKNDPLHFWGLSKTQSVTFDGHTFQLAPPEYVIIRKLQFYKEGQSQKHLRDINRILASSEGSLNQEFLDEQIKEKLLFGEWESALQHEI